MPITEKSPAFSILPLPIFLYFFPIFPSHFYILSDLIYPSGSSLLLGRFPSIFVCSIILGIFPSPTPIRFPNYLNLIFSMSFFTSITDISNLMLIFLNLSYVLFKISLKNLITMAWILLFSLFVVVQVSALYRNILLKCIFKIWSLHFLFISLFLKGRL